MKKLALLALAAVAMLSLHAPQTAAQESTAPPLTNQLNELRKAWLFGDDASAEARLAALEGDQGLSGDIPRWYASMRAALALKRGDTKQAMTVFRRLLKDARDARGYVRAVRILVAFGKFKEALELVREGR